MISTGAAQVSEHLSDLADRGPEFTAWANDALKQFSMFADGLADAATAAAHKLAAAVEEFSGSSLSDKKGDEVVYAAAAVAVAGAAAVAGGIGRGVGAETAGGGDNVRGDGTEGEGVPLQPIGARQEMGATNEGEERSCDEGFIRIVVKNVALLHVVWENGLDEVMR